MSWLFISRPSDCRKCRFRLPQKKPPSNVSLMMMRGTFISSMRFPSEIHGILTAFGVTQLPYTLGSYKLSKVRTAHSNPSEALRPKVGACGERAGQVMAVAVHAYCRCQVLYRVDHPGVLIGPSIFLLEPEKRTHSPSRRVGIAGLRANPRIANFFDGGKFPIHVCRDWGGLTWHFLSHCMKNITQFFGPDCGLKTS
jgi:hypothetical protein